MTRMTVTPADNPAHAINQQIIEQTNFTAPAALRTAVLAVTNGAAPHAIAATVRFENNTSTWYVTGCTDRALFRILATKANAEWYGSGMRGGADNASINIELLPFRAVTSARFDFEELVRDIDDNHAVEGTWTFATDTKSIEISTSGDNYQARGAHHALVAAVLAAI